MDIREANLRAHDVYVPTDSGFQKQCRLKQALWREAHGLPIGSKPTGTVLGSRIAMPRARTLLENFLTPTIRDVAYGAFVAREHVFASWTLEQVVDALDGVIDPVAVAAIRGRYLFT